MLGMLLENHQRSIYAEQCGVDEKVARGLLMQAVQRHGLNAAGGTSAFVSERDGAVEGFIIGVLDRVYHIGTALMAQDMFFIAGPSTPLREASGLLDAYIGWAEANKDVIDCKLSATSVIGPTDRVEKLFQRKGFARCGVIYERKLG